MTEITKLMSVADIVKACPTRAADFDKYGLKGCGGEHVPPNAEFFAAIIDGSINVRNEAVGDTSVQELWPHDMQVFRSHGLNFAMAREHHSVAFAAGKHGFDLVTFLAELNAAVGTAALPKLEGIITIGTEKSS